MSGCFKAVVPPGYRRLAWNGVSFCVPANWELAVYRFLRRQVTRIEVEDEYAIRIEAEWVRGRKAFDLKRIMQRYEQAAKPLTLKADDQFEVKGLPDGWHATGFVFKETGSGGDGGLKVVRHELLTAFYLCPRTSLFVFFILHFLPEDREDPSTIIRQMASTFQEHQDDAATPWQLFDIAFWLPREFSLREAVFDIGAKLMAFAWRRRRYYLWYFSCADVFLKGGLTPAEWACGYLNDSRLFKGAVFHPDGHGGIAWRRRRPFLFGHWEEIARCCFRYQVVCRLVEPDNKLMVAVFHHRHESDLEQLRAKQL